MATPGFRPTHVVPQHGMPAWETPDPARPTVPLDPLLPVQLVERRGDRGHGLCANGWSARVDGRFLVAVPQDPPGTDSDHPEHAYLTDFGLTKKSLSLTGFTTVGQFVGTLDYVAPEQISGRPVDGRCDVYGFACVVSECLAGRPPFRRDDDMALLWAHQYDEPPPLTESRPDLAPQVDGVFAKALAKSPDDRHDSCLAFVAALRTALTGTAPGRTTRRRRWTCAG